MADPEIETADEALHDPEVKADVEAIAPGAEEAVEEETEAAETAAAAAELAAPVESGAGDREAGGVDLGVTEFADTESALAVAVLADAEDGPVVVDPPDVAADPPAAADPTPTAAVSPVATSDLGEDGRPNPRKVRVGLVVSTAMDKTAVVAVIERVRHRRYAKTVQRTKRFYAHDPVNETRVGDRVRLAETRPMSKLKRWRIVEILDRAK